MTYIKTFIPKLKPEDRKWVLVDAKGQAPGRLATHVARLLLGKDKVTFTPHLDNGSGVIVINAAKIAVTGRKTEQKIYTRYSGYPSGLKRVVMKDLQAEKPEEVIVHAVKGMLPHNRLGRALMRHLRVTRDEQHPHQAQLAVGQGAAGKKAKGHGKGKAHGSGKHSQGTRPTGQQTKEAQG